MADNQKINKSFLVFFLFSFTLSMISDFVLEEISRYGYMNNTTLAALALCDSCMPIILESTLRERQMEKLAEELWGALLLERSVPRGFGWPCVKKYAGLYNNFISNLIGMGNMEFLMWFISKHQVTFKPCVWGVVDAIRSGNFQVFMWIIDIIPPLSVNGIKHVIRHSFHSDYTNTLYLPCHVDVKIIEWIFENWGSYFNLHELEYKLWVYMLVVAKNYPVCEFILKKYPHVSTGSFHHSFIHAAVCNNDFYLVEFILQHCHFTEKSSIPFYTLQIKDTKMATYLKKMRNKSLSQ